MTPAKKKKELVFNVEKRLQNVKKNDLRSYLKLKGDRGHFSTLKMNQVDHFSIGSIFNVTPV